MNNKLRVNNMSNNPRASRRGAVDYLIRIHGSQSNLARVLKHPTLTQPILSSVQRGKRSLEAHEARAIEGALGIPSGWMDRNNWVRAGWRVIKEYRNLGTKEREIVDRMVAFVVAQRT